MNYRYNDEVEEIKHVLSLYGLYQRKEQQFLQEAMELEMEIDDMMDIQGINFEEKIGGSRNPKETPAIHQKQHELVYADKKANEYREKYEFLDEVYQIEEKLIKLPKQQRVLIELALFKKVSYDKIAMLNAKDGYIITRQSMGERVRNALNSFIKIKVQTDE